MENPYMRLKVQFHSQWYKNDTIFRNKFVERTITLYTENCNILLRKIKDLNKRRDTAHQEVDLILLRCQLPLN